MRELAMTELDGQLAEQLPQRELMGILGHSNGCGGGDTQIGLVNLDDVQVQVNLGLITIGNTNGS